MNQMLVTHPSQLSGVELSEYESWLDNVDAESGCTGREMVADQHLFVEQRFPTVEKPYVVKVWNTNKVFGFSDLEKAMVFHDRRNYHGSVCTLFVNKAV